MQPNNMQIDIYCINLDERKDKWKKIVEQFSKIPEINLIRVPAIKNEIGWIGCGLSHISIVKNYIANDKFLIVIEDDCLIINLNDFYNRLLNIFNWLDANLDKWDIFNGNPGFIRSSAGCQVLCNELSIIKYMAGSTANFLIYNTKKKNLYDRLLVYEKNILACAQIINNRIGNVKKSKKKFLILVNGKQVVYNAHHIRRKVVYDKFIHVGFLCITSVPFLTSQYPSQSDIEKKNVNYDNVIKLSENTLTSFIDNHRRFTLKNLKE